DEKINEFLNLSGDKIFLNSSSFDLEADHSILINNLEKLITDLKETYNREIRIVVNDGKAKMKNVVIPEHLKENIYISSNPDYLTILFHDPRIETIISTFGQGTADLLSAFAPGKRIIGLNLVTDQKANIRHLNSEREFTGEPMIPSISWKQLTSDLLESEIKNKHVLGFITNIEEIRKRFNLRVNQGAVFYLIRMLKSLNLSDELREVIIQAISDIGEQ
ncbi:MAG: hypothetical protein ACMG57_03725, partial [Candidatus Dojkabacteria bacterium]